MDLIVISYPESFFNEEQLIARFFQLGLQRFHLRKPAWGQEQIEQLLRGIPAEYYPRIVLHDQFDLAEKYHLGGIHFTGKTKMKIEQWLEFPGTKSISCHSLEELKMLGDKVDYAFLSPVFSSLSKPGYEGNLDLQKVSSFLRLEKKYSVVALGGVSDQAIRQCIQFGFDAVAVLGAIWQKELEAALILNRFIKLLNTCQQNVPM
ncbi:thiamine phosphate synthase [Sunxiuqinia indica]|uniref:thiamine phosphate synthase n=1 Tax=Sunxiuqinia indica TaxID=2692584 RepID=UPI001358BD60|nr:thiamine phosphate synthase [Sunxiuqinia indica]